MFYKKSDFIGGQKAKSQLESPQKAIRLRFSNSAYITAGNLAIPVVPGRSSAECIRLRIQCPITAHVTLDSLFLYSFAMTPLGPWGIW